MYVMVVLSGSVYVMAVLSGSVCMLWLCYLVVFVCYGCVIW